MIFLTEFIQMERPEGLDAPIYLIDSIDCDNHLIHRERRNKEPLPTDYHNVFEHEGREFIVAVNNLPTFEQAVRVVQRYYHAHETLHERFGEKKRPTLKNE